MNRIDQNEREEATRASPASGDDEPQNHTVAFEDLGDASVIPMDRPRMVSVRSCGDGGRYRPLRQPVGLNVRVVLARDLQIDFVLLVREPNETGHDTCAIRAPGRRRRRADAHHNEPNDEGISTPNLVQ